jgi:hypothetical protein
LPAGENPAGVWSFGKGKKGPTRIESVARTGSYIDSAGATLVDKIRHEELRSEIGGVCCTGGRKNDAVRNLAAVAPIVKRVTTVRAVRELKGIHVQGVAAARRPTGIVKRICARREVLGRQPEIAVDINVKTRAKRVWCDVNPVYGCGGEFGGGINGKAGIGDVEGLWISAQAAWKPERRVIVPVPTGKTDDE